MPTPEVNSLELEFLFSINFSLHVPTAVYEKYVAELCNHMTASCAEAAALAAAASGREATSPPSPHGVVPVAAACDCAKAPRIAYTGESCMEGRGAGLVVARPHVHHACRYPAHPMGRRSMMRPWNPNSTPVQRKSCAFQACARSWALGALRCSAQRHQLAVRSTLVMAAPAQRRV